MARTRVLHTHIKAKRIALSIVWPNANAFGAAVRACLALLVGLLSTGNSES